MATRPFVDTHIHYWDLKDENLRYVWLDRDWDHPILGNIDGLKVLLYSADEFIGETRFQNVPKIVHVQAAIGIEDPVEETRWLQEQADRTGFPHGIVGHCDLMEPNAEETLERHLAHANFRGVRDFAAGTNLDNPDWLRGLRAMGDRNLVFCIDTVWEQMADVAKVADDTGVDSRAIVGLLGAFDFTLQVEDPAPGWIQSPRRYERMAARYRPLMPANSRLMFDINVVPDRAVETTHLPLDAAAGTELLGAVRAARAAGTRIALYGDSTVRSRDLELISFALADRTHVAAESLAWRVETPDAVEVAVPARLHDFYVDGVTWPYWRPGAVLLPPGTHVVSSYRPWLRLFDLSGLSPQLLSINATVNAAQAAHGHLQFDYTSDGRALALLGRPPKEILVDDAASPDVTQPQDHGVVVLLPKGRHRVEVSGSSPGGLLLDVVSVISSSLIVAFGTAAVLMLVLVYGGIRLRRLGRVRGN